MTNKEAINLISRNKSVFQYDTETTKALNLAIKALEERPHGEWITESKLYGGYGDSVLVITCSICKTSFVYRGKTHNFCSNCGADMRGTEND